MPAYDNEGATISMEDVRGSDRTVTMNSIEEELAQRRAKQMKPKKSTVASRREQAVCVRRAHKKYGTSKNPNVILDGLNMTVPKGSIYGLLGASGCGKTTLLSCIVGRRRLNSGEIWVLGGKPGSPGSGVPGPRIGYMPQEVALSPEFTIRETLVYFGMIANMDNKDIDERVEFLINFLQLPNPTRQVKNLSGGQQRRTSFAAALIHDPELLILDEPTVGVDPVLRQAIWDHLVDITKEGRKTVIITTHYIDETKQANTIGLMRGGKFLAEESPDELLSRYQADSLEQVFLKLSVLQNMGRRRRSSILADVLERVELPSIPNPSSIDLEEAEIGEISGEFGDNTSMSSRGRVINTTEIIAIDSIPPEEAHRASFRDILMPLKPHHMKALIWKNFWSLFRNYGAIAFIIGLPLVQMVLFCLAIGHYPESLPIFVVNHEVNSSEVLCEYDKTCPQDPATFEWTLKNFSCMYLEYLSKRQQNLIPYPSKAEAMDDAARGKARVVLVFHSNFSSSLQDRVTDPRNADSFTINNSDMEAHLDDTDKQVQWMLAKDIQYAFTEAAEYMAEQCDLPKRIMSIPVHFNKPIYGVENADFTDFAGPGVILTIIFFLAVAVTSGAMLAERNEGILERSLVSGITGTEILFSHVLAQMLVMVAQSVIVMLIGFVLFGLTMNGPLGWVILLILITGLCGMTFGFVVSCICDTDRTATYLALGSFLPMIMLCGIIWPIEGMHIILQYISYVLPLTLSTESLRSMLQRGWSIVVPTVYSGFISTSVWIAIYLTSSILLLKFKKG